MSLVLNLLVTLLVASATSATPLVVRSGPRPIVSDPSTGVSYQGNLSTDVESFLNIRFAEDTGGSNRFAPPKPYHYPRDAVVNASHYGAACPQAVQSLLFGSITDVSEDCLTLRIDRLHNVTATNLPVMVYIFGGGFTVGQIYQTNYDPVGLLRAAADNGSPIIYAGMNYRVSMFGFAASSALASEGALNIGLYDQRLALEWIKDNIHLFGGNPNNITIFGESAGAMSIGHQINAYGGEKPVPFHRAIMQSGESTTVSGTVSNISEVHTSEVTKLVNCTSHNSSAELACVRELPLDRLLKTVVSYELEVNPNALYVWQPIVPNHFIPDAPSKLLREGRFAKNIDIIAGWNANDGSEFVTPNITTDSEVITSVTYPSILDEALQQELLSLYPVSSFSATIDGNKTVSPQYFRASQMYRDNSFTCPALLLAQTMANASNQTTTNYLFEMNQTLFTSFFAKSGTPYYGIAHGSDVPFVFNELFEYPNATRDQIQLAKAISTSWALFANSGETVARAAGKGNALQGWPEGYQKGTNGSSVAIRVLGGPNDGPVVLRQGGSGEEVLASENLIGRCALWNSEAVMNQQRK